MNSRTLFELIGTADEQLLEQSEQTVPTRGRGGAVKKVFLLAAAVIAALAVTATAAAVSEGESIWGWIWSALSRGDADGFTNQALLQSQIEQGEWIYLNGDSIAVIIPESPVKIMLSHDKGRTWTESFVQGSEEMEIYGELRSGFPYYGGYIGFFGDGGGYLVLTAGVTMNNQPMRIYLTDDGGNTWSEIGNPYGGWHISVLTGTGFSCTEIGFISYRYYEDAGPDIWWTRNGGDTWEKLVVEIPEQYSEYRFTPGSPTFNGPNGIYPITIEGHSAPDYAPRTIYMRTSDYGLTWNFDE